MKISANVVLPREPQQIEVAVAPIGQVCAEVRVPLAGKDGSAGHAGH